MTVPRHPYSARRKRLPLIWLVLAVLVSGFFLFSPTLMKAPKPKVEQPVSLSAGKLTLSVLDVGQGDAILLQAPGGETLLVDAGDGEHGVTVVRELRARGVTKLDLLVATHPHADHIGGMPDVLRAFPVSQVWDNGYNTGSRTQLTFLRMVKEKGIRYGKPKRGTIRQLGAVAIEVLAPSGVLSGTESDTNNNSLVLRVSYHQVSMLLTGDMETEERQAVDWPQSTILKVAHHGSRNGTDAAFLGQVQPKLALISCARDNEYGHPHAETLEALREAGATVKTTATDGAITVMTDGTTYAVTASKKATAPYAPAASEEYIGNVHSHTFHRSTCESLPAPQNRITFRTRDEAIAQGYHPCGRCRP